MIWAKVVSAIAMPYQTAFGYSIFARGGSNLYIDDQIGYIGSKTPI